MTRRDMPPVANKSFSHAEAAAWDVEQHVSMTPEERQRVARILEARAYPGVNRDVRECHRAG